MKQIRLGVFETNSSSTHALAIFTDDEYCKWQQGELYVNKLWATSSSAYAEKDKVTFEEAVDILYSSNMTPEYSKSEFMLMESEDQEQYLTGLGLNNINTFYPALEVDVSEYTTAHGDHLNIVCAYGAEY